jgi:hypothetical protein
MDEHGGLRGLGSQNVIRYVHGDDYCIVVCSAIQALRWTCLKELETVWAGLSKIGGRLVPL